MDGEEGSARVMRTGCFGAMGLGQMLRDRHYLPIHSLPDRAKESRPQIHTDSHPSPPHCPTTFPSA
jgi:hypothetical protein